jgi:hypothetical protein
MKLLQVKQLLFGYIQPEFPFLQDETVGQSVYF